MKLNNNFLTFLIGPGASMCLYRLVHQARLFFSTRPALWITLLLLLAYAPYLGNRVVRTAGDEKVYVAQAVEMDWGGRWFLQTLAEEPNYYKGPLHYILLRVGILVFDQSMWATLYMNLLFLILGAVSLSGLIRRRMPEYGSWSVWGGIGFALCAGIYAHAFASQMEVELACLFAIGANLLDRSQIKEPGWSVKKDFIFWLLVGLVGTLKSPLHSGLLGCSALLFWLIEGELWIRLKKPLCWAAVFSGVALCLLAYAPAYFLDQAAFLKTYVYRETLDKPSNGVPWERPLIPLFTYTLFPWFFTAFVVYLDFLCRGLRASLRNIGVGFQFRFGMPAGPKRLILLGISIIVPSILFFIWHPYRGQNYNLPIVSGLFLILTAVWATQSGKFWQGFYRFSIFLSLLVVLLLPVLLSWGAVHFSPLPEWWPPGLVPFTWICCGIAAFLLWKGGVRSQHQNGGVLAVGSVFFYLSLGWLLSVIGEREMKDLRAEIAAYASRNEKISLSYYNVQRHLFSEWGYLRFMVPADIKGVHSKKQLHAAIRGRDLILVPGDQFLGELKREVKKEFPTLELVIKPWKRWRTKGRCDDGSSCYLVAWNRKSFSPVERNFYMVRAQSARTETHTVTTK